MALTQPQIDDVARRLAQQIFVTAAATAHSGFDDLQSAVDSIDTAMDANTEAAQGAYPVTALKTALLEYARTGAPNLTVQEGGVALAYWALKTVGLL